MHSTPASFTCSTAATARCFASCRVACIESSSCTSLVETNTWTISTPESMAASMSPSTTRASPQTVVFVAAAMSLGLELRVRVHREPASMTWVFMSSSVAAMRRFVVAELNDVRGDCSPSRNVVSKIRTGPISMLEAIVPWKNSIRRGVRRSLRDVCHRLTEARSRT